MEIRGKSALNTTLYRHLKNKCWCSRRCWCNFFLSICLWRKNWLIWLQVNQIYMQNNVERQIRTCQEIPGLVDGIMWQIEKWKILLLCFCLLASLKSLKSIITGVPIHYWEAPFSMKQWQEIVTKQSWNFFPSKITLTIILMTQQEINSAKLLR